MKKLSTLLVVVAGSFMLGACGGAEESEEALEARVAEEAEVSAMACYSYSAGSSSSCKPTATWKAYASDACAAKGMSLSSYTVSTPCATSGSYSYVKFTCCQ